MTIKLQLIGFIVAVLVGAAAIVFEFAAQLYTYETEDTLEQKISEATSLMGSVSQTIEDIESDLQERIALVDALKEEAAVAQEIKNLTEEQQQALASLLRQQLESDNTWSFWTGVAQNAFFMLLGLGLGEFVHRWRARAAPAGCG